ncbi:C_GCAxxG_C_C family protein [Desulfotomaculum nigrificans CO-1-SRB]|uniref:C_GCAxxG_C_C family protein n=1 Tax=Desulfotomaculum nigrificans (strain DSM 14880 / VKM B-2319 / CO-1-SRB) TaxID=868595 RepID=F6B6P6_DESCC|nr:DV_1555 family C-GCAxxG-C-C protein [Desulfotomaculum nigrificans]AEF94420.1 C_GCAxxG_C_C family protein [Desulfotomaculum nigrificans CO-1-SRB]
MSGEMFRMFELAQQGFACSQILLIMGLEARGESNTDLVRAMTGLAGGMGFSGENCGALTGGACLLGLYAGRGTAEEMPHEKFDLMVNELVAWFKQEVGAECGGINCSDILGDGQIYKTATPKCSVIVSNTLEKVKKILLNAGINFSGDLE